MSEAIEEAIKLLRSGAKQISLSGKRLKSEDLSLLFQELKNDLKSETFKTTDLNLWNNTLGPQGASEIAALLEADCPLTSVNLGCNNIGVEGGKALADMLAVNKKLICLCIYFNHLGKRGIELIADTLEAKNKTLTSLNVGNNELGLEGVDAVSKILRTNTTLSTLILSSNNIMSEGAKKIADSLVFNTTLTEINLDRNKIGSEGARAILRSGGCLKRLSLASNCIAEDGALSAEGERCVLLLIPASLEALTISDNKLKFIPMTFVELKNLIDFEADDNDWEYPPQHVVAKGVERIKHYLLENASNSWIKKIRAWAVVLFTLLALILRILKPILFPRPKND